ncbi:MAG: gluconate 2-dehydrogenase subunit 3 family protein [Pseudomonadota bacterium]
MGATQIIGKREGQTRRELLRNAQRGVAAVALGGVGAFCPRTARADGAPMAVLKSAAIVKLLESFGETLVPGASEAGLAHYIDDQLAKRPEDSLLMIRYMDIPPPHDGFYVGAMAALDASSKVRFGAPFTELSTDQKRAFVGELSSGNPPGWSGPPSPLVYFVVRADAVDVVYGTEEGFERLGVPYLPHIAPETNW